MKQWKLYARQLEVAALKPKVVEALLAGQSSKAIAMDFGISYRTVRRISQQAGLPVRQRRSPARSPAEGMAAHG